MNSTIFSFACFLSISISTCFAMPYDDRYWGPSNTSFSFSSSSAKPTLSDADADALSPFPRLIQDWCRQCPDDYHTKELIKVGRKMQNGTTYDSWDVTYHAEEICETLNLSPHTFFTVVSTCTAIAEKQPFDRSALTISYDQKTELYHKMTLIRQMPTILADICSKNPDCCFVSNLIACFYSNNKDIVRVIIHMMPDKTLQPSFISTINFAVARILIDFNRYMSPQTVARLARECRDWFFEKKPVSKEPYNKALETEQCESIRKRFPTQLKESNSIKDFHIAKLICFAHLLENRAEENVIESFIETVGSHSDTNIKYYGDIHYHIKKITQNNATAYQLTDQFIAIFKSVQTPSPLPTSTASSSSTLAVSASPVSINPAIDVIKMCYDTFVLACRKQDNATPDKNIPNKTTRTMLLTPLEECYKKLLAQAQSANTEQLEKLCDSGYIKKQIEESAIPQCPVCFEGYSDHFIGNLGGIEHQLPCSHAMCTECLKDWHSTCPICRAPIKL